MIYRRNDSSFYWFDFLFESRRYQGSTKMRNRRAAEQVEAKLKIDLAERRAGLPERRVVPTLREYRNHFLEVIGALGRKARTVVFYRTCLGNLDSAFGTKRLDEISAEAIRGYAESRRLDGRAGRTVNCDLATLRRMMSIAVKEELLVQNPFAARRVEFCRESRTERVISYTEEQKYLAAAAPFLRDAAIIMLETGLRPSELLRIHSRDVNLWDSPPTLRIPDSKTQSGRRELPISSRMLVVIRSRMEQAKGGYLFPFRTQDNRLDWGRPMVELRKAHTRALKAAGISSPFRIYDLRHSFGTRAAEAGTDPLTLQRLMGHASLATTGRYIHLSKRHLAEAQQRIEEYRREREAAELGYTQGNFTEPVN